MSNKKLPQILAKDRYFLTQQAKKISKQADVALAEKLQQKYDQVLEKSTQAVAKRIASVPVIQLNEELPVSQQSQQLVQAIKDHQVIIVAGETGSGKTTQLPKIALMAGRGVTGQIGHTQPRRLAARSVANRIADEMGEKLGESISYKVRFNEEGSANSLVKLMTDGILLAELGYDRFLSRYDTIIIDEAHERSLNIDFIMGYLKNLLPKRPDLKVIITSATLDTQRFSDYFSRFDRRTKKRTLAPIFNVEGRSYPVEVLYRPLTDEPIHSSDDDAFDDFEDNLPLAVISAVTECFDDAQAKGKPNQSDILIFCATESEIRELQEVLIAEIIRNPSLRHTQVLPLFARQTFAEQQRIFQTQGTGRRIIISTNVAETALTVPNIGYVIDLGFARLSRYSYRSRVQRLPIEAISQAAANQRKGRCGRISAGVCIRLYSEEDFNSRLEFTEPEILRTNLASVILQMANLRLGTVDDFDFIEAPDSRLIKDGTKLLQELGAIQTSKSAERSLNNKPSNNYKRTIKPQTQLTAVGKKMARMPIDPRLSRMLIAGGEYDCLVDMLIIVSALAVQDPRERPQEKRTQADQKHALFRQENSDFLFYISLWNALFNKDEEGNTLSSNQRKAFTKKHFLSFPRVREWQKTHQQLQQMVSELKLGELIDKKTDKSSLLNKNNKRLKLNKPVKMDKAQQQARQELLTAEQQKHTQYANLHRALLTGLLSFIAHKHTDSKVRGEYLATRQQKTKIFPASTVFKTVPSWVMAFEVVETSQVFMRCVAKIEPEWIIANAGSLLKYHHYEPHWSKKTGRVKAYAQITLFGLVIINKQLCNYEPVNVRESREIFIRDAVVAGSLYNQGRNPPFSQHNIDKIADTLRIEDKLRRRDLLVDEETLYQFYDSKIPEHIASRHAFEDWRVEVEAKDKHYLFFSDQDILTQSAPTTGDFPENWRLGSIKLPLSYVFDPASDDDGVSIRVPLRALPQLNAIELLWGIAGWRYELVTQLLKTLPKEIRRQIVPIPDTAKQIYEELENHHQQGLLKQLCHFLTTKKGITVTADNFQPQKIDRYLQPQICVVDDKNRLIEKGRDLHTLQIRHATETSQAVHVSKGRHDSFPEHFSFSKNRHSAGIAIKEYSALVAEVEKQPAIKSQNKKLKSTADKKAVGNSLKYLGQTVAINQYTDIHTALFTHRQGVLSLIKNKLGAKQKQLTSQIDTSFKLAFAPLGQLDKLKTIVVDATLDACLHTHYVEFDHSNQLPEQLNNEQSQLLARQLPFSYQEYQQTEQAILSNFLITGQAILKLLKEVYSRWQRVRQQLLMLDTEIFAESMDDIEDQLDDLHLADFIYRINSEYWQQYPRYLQALEVRIDRLEHNLDGDIDAIYELDVHMERIAGRSDDYKIADYRWLVEEFRIQLFAQPMKTKGSVSQKRLTKVWNQMA